MEQQRRRRRRGAAGTGDGASEAGSVSSQASAAAGASEGVQAATGPSPPPMSGDSASVGSSRSARLKPIRRRRRRVDNGSDASSVASHATDGTVTHKAEDDGSQKAVAAGAAESNTDQQGSTSENIPNAGPSSSGGDSNAAAATGSVAVESSSENKAADELPSPVSRASSAAHSLPIDQNSAEVRPRISSQMRVPEPGERPNDDAVLHIKLRASSSLQAHQHLLHPVVRVTIVGTDGKPVLKSSPEVPAVLPHEAGVRIILPLLSQAFSLAKSFSDTGDLSCHWNELMVVNEKWTTFASRPSLAFFEIIDFKSADDLQGDNGKLWHHVAWAFTRLDSALNADDSAKHASGCRHPSSSGYGSSLRLQLWQYKKGFSWRKRVERSLIQGNAPLPFEEWKQGNMRPYMASLWVDTLAALPPLDVVHGRAVHASQREEGLFTIHEMQQGAASAHRQDVGDDDKDVLDCSTHGSNWIGAAGRWCRVPNAASHRLEMGGSKGSLAVGFSSNGIYLAASSADASLHRVIVWNAASGNQVIELDGHHDTVYDIDWAPGRDEFASASADGTVKLWAPFAHFKQPTQVSPRANSNAGHKASKTLLHELGHPCFVYCARYCTPGSIVGQSGSTIVEPRGTRLLATGAFDGLVRLWDASKGILLQTLPGHSARVDSMCFDRENGRVITGDGNGTLRVWQVQELDQRLTEKKVWSEPETAGQPISGLDVDIDGRRIAVVHRDSRVRIIETTTFAVVQRLAGIVCGRTAVRVRFSPDGRMVMAGSEDGFPGLWSADTGEAHRLQWDVGLQGLVCAVAWNPWFRMVACTAYSSRQPVVLWNYDRSLVPTRKGISAASAMEMDIKECLEGRWAELREAFENFDTDDSGSISLDEFLSVLHRLNIKASDSAMEAMFKVVDSDNSGEINYQEFLRRFAPEHAMQDSSIPLESTYLAENWNAADTMMQQLRASLTGPLRRDSSKQAPMPEPALPSVQEDPEPKTSGDRGASPPVAAAEDSTVAKAN